MGDVVDLSANGTNGDVVLTKVGRRAAGTEPEVAVRRPRAKRMPTSSDGSRTAERFCSQ